MKPKKDRMLDSSDYALIFAVISIIFFCAFTYIYDTTTPAGSDLISAVDDRIRELKSAVQERENVDHYWPLTGTQVSDEDAGKHRQITFYDVLSDDPTVSSGEGQIYLKTVGSQEELFFRDDTNSGLQITSAGTLNITSSDLVGTLANNTYFSAVNAAGDGTVNLIKADSNDVAVVPDDSQTASNAAPTQTKSIVNKKYVDDHDIVIQTVQTSYATANQVSAVIADDDSIPQQSEGEQLVALAITPTSATNKLKIEAYIPIGFDSSGNFAIACLFQDSITNALTVYPCSAVYTLYQTIPLVHYMTAGTTSETTFKLRLGVTAGLVTVNGKGGARRWGGKCKVEFIITELKV
jgi:hypothetical protein